MLDDIKDEKLNPLNIHIDPKMSSPKRDFAYKRQVNKILQDIEDERYGPLGKPMWDSIEEFQLCNEGRYNNNMKKKEAEIWDLQR